YIEGDTTSWETEPLVRLAKERQLMAYTHSGFWQAMDTLRDKDHLEDLWARGAAPWKVWGTGSFCKADIVQSNDVRAHWKSRATSDSWPQSTSLDYYLRDIEFRVLADQIEKQRPSRVFDIGCGDGYTTLRLAGRFPDVAFVGGDYAHPMVENARANVEKSKVK